MKQTHTHTHLFHMRVITNVC